MKKHNRIPETLPGEGLSAAMANAWPLVSLRGVLREVCSPQMNDSETPPWRQTDARQRHKYITDRARRVDAARVLATHTKEEWEKLKSEFDFRCVRCGTDEYKVCKDHIIPLYQGRSGDGIDNIQPLCAPCNCSKGAETFNWKEYRRAFGFTEPQEVFMGAGI